MIKNISDFNNRVFEKFVIMKSCCMDFIFQKFSIEKAKYFLTQHIEMKPRVICVPMILEIVLPPALIPLSNIGRLTCRIDILSIGRTRYWRPGLHHKHGAQGCIADGPPPQVFLEVVMLQVTGDLAYVTSMVRKDVLRTDRHHKLLETWPTSQAWCARMYCGQTATTSISRGSDVAGYWRPGLRHKHGAQGCIADGPPPQVFLEVVMLQVTGDLAYVTSMVRKDVLRTDRHHKLLVTWPTSQAWCARMYCGRTATTSISRGSDVAGYWRLGLRHKHGAQGCIADGPPPQVFLEVVMLQVTGDLAYVTSMVRKDVLRTDRHHKLLETWPTSQAWCARMYCGQTATTSISRGSDVAGYWRLGLRHKHGAQGCIADGPPPQVFLEVVTLQVTGDLAYVTSMVRKDVLRTDRHHKPGLRHKHGAQGCIADGPPPQVFLEVVMLQVTGDLAYVTSMVRKDVLRTDRHHKFYAGSDDNQNIASLFNILTTFESTAVRLLAVAGAERSSHDPGSEQSILALVLSGASTLSKGGWHAALWFGWLVMWPSRSWTMGGSGSPAFVWMCPCTTKR
ncbi:hypothetical protein PR048_032009 [Dryococelus australis]|uniref:Uncharacterized protein n=1 Tax=Dryococelus australis TaxID=614101 RepID=A0ABQ9G6W5_9NEOP|nr:hypothetical protein PR048_032009 [Dryococelus australis]